MTDTPRQTDDAADLREAIAALTERLDRIEARATQPSAFDSAQARLTEAWDALRGKRQEQQGRAALESQPRGIFWAVLTVCAILVALLLAVELFEEVFDGLWHVARWFD